MIRVFVVDDHAVVRQGIRQILTETTDIVLSGEAEGTSGLLENIRESQADILLLDLSLPGRGGIDALKDITRACPQLKVLVLSMHPEDQVAVRTVKAGASGYLEKSSTSSELLNAIRTVARGRKYLSPAMMERLVLGLRSEASRPLYEALSDRELRVLQLITTGKRASEIAAELSLSVRTISTYRNRLLAKLAMTSNAEIVRYSLDQGLVT